MANSPWYWLALVRCRHLPGQLLRRPRPRRHPRLPARLHPLPGVAQPAAQSGGCITHYVRNHSGGTSALRGTATGSEKKALLIAVQTHASLLQLGCQGLFLCFDLLQLTGSRGDLGVRDAHSHTAASFICSSSE